MAGRIDLKDLPPEVRAKLGLPRPARAKAGMTKNDVRTAAIRVLNVIADLTPSERARVLTHAERINKL